ncbi:MAG: DUF1508 domain-containing protein [Clostridia bacterium]
MLLPIVSAFSFSTLMENKPVFYGIIAAVALLLFIIVLAIANKSKKKKTKTKSKDNVVVSKNEKAKADIKPVAKVAAEKVIPVEKVAVPVPEVNSFEAISQPVAIQAQEEVVIEPASESDIVYAPAPESSINEPIPAFEELFNEPDVIAPVVDEYRFAPVPQKTPEDGWKPAKINPTRKKKEVEPVVATDELNFATAPIKSKPAKKVNEPSPVVENVAPQVVEDVKADDVAPLPADDFADKPKVTGKYVIEKNGSCFQYSLIANNGQLLYESREYASIASCKSGIETFKKNVANCDYRVDVDKNGGHKYIFKKGNSIYIGESYRTAKAAENSAESVRRFAGISSIVE